MKLSSLLLASFVILAACSPQTNPTPPASTGISPGPAAPTTEPPPSATVEPPTATPTETPLPGPTSTPTPDLSNFVGNFPDLTAYEWKAVVTGLEQPDEIKNAHDGSGRLFVVERPGRIRIITNGRVAKTPFLDIQSKIQSFGTEQGLLGLAFDPAYIQNGRFYVNYTDLTGDTVIARYEVSGDDPDVADPEGETILLQIDQPYLNHNGGALAFGPDGYLYMGLGDGGSQGDPFGNGQSVNTLLAKILRVDVSKGEPYAIPEDNPFAGGGGQPEIWAYGLRNPWRIAFDSSNGNLYIADVGQSDWEEIDFVPAGTPGGLNFGWNTMEGTHLYAGGPTQNLVLPAAEYSHSEGGCSVTGGEVYRGQVMPDWNGVYFFGDYCTGKIWGLLPAREGWNKELLFDSGFGITSFGLDESGELYVANYGDGGIYQLVPK
jgi:glucose/arabinose dehydrogenase